MHFCVFWRNDFNSLPPTHIITTDFDPLRDEGEYRKALVLVEFLVDRDDLENPLYELLSARLSNDEKQAPEFSVLRQQQEDTPHGVALARTLMNQ